MIKSFADRVTENIYHHEVSSKKARKRLPAALWPAAQRKLDQIDSVERIERLREPPGNRLERLRSDRGGQWSIRINDQYRVCFHFHSGNAYDVEIVDYH